LAAACSQADRQDRPAVLGQRFELLKLVEIDDLQAGDVGALQEPGVPDAPVDLVHRPRVDWNPWATRTIG